MSPGAPEGLSPKAVTFFVALRALCLKHDVVLAVSGYDALQIWDYCAKDDPVMANGIEDRTTPGWSAAAFNDEKRKNSA